MDIIGNSMMLSFHTANIPNLNVPIWAFCFLYQWWELFEIWYGMRSSNWWVIDRPIFLPTSTSRIHMAHIFRVFRAWLCSSCFSHIWQEDESCKNILNTTGIMAKFTAIRRIVLILPLQKWIISALDCGTPEPSLCLKTRVYYICILPIHQDWKVPSKWFLYGVYSI